MYWMEGAQLEINDTQLIIRYVSYWYEEETVYGGGYDITFTYYVFSNSFQTTHSSCFIRRSWLDLTYADMTLGTNFSQLPSPGIIIDSNYGAYHLEVKFYGLYR